MNLFLLHGLGADHRAFQRFMRLLPESWKCTSLDLLGHGEAPHPESGYSLVDHANYIASVLNDDNVSSKAPAAVLGHSYGAATAVALAALHPTLVQQIILLDPVVRLDIQGHDANSLTARMIKARRNGTLPELVTAAYPTMSIPLQKWTIDTWKRMSLGVVDELDPDWMRFADRVTCPVAVIHGDLDKGGSGDIAADYFDNSCVIRIADAGHYLHASHARETAAAVVQASSYS